MNVIDKQLRIALFHNLEACGAKRALWHLVKFLSKHGHELDLYTFETSDENFLSLSPFVRQVIRERLQAPKLTMPARLPIIDQSRNVWRRIRHLSEIDIAHQRLAQRINQGDYDIAFVHSGMFAHVPDVLRYLDIPSVFFCQEPSRRIHERQIILKKIPKSFEKDLEKKSLSSSWIMKADGLCYALTEPVYKRRYHQEELKNIQFATRVLTNSYYTRELTYKTYGIFPRVNYLGVDTKHFRPNPKISKENLVISVGRFDTLKQHHTVIESVGRISKQYRPKVAIIGETRNLRYVDYLKNLAQSLNVSLQIQVSVSEEELIRWYNRAKAVVFVPILEPFGFVSLEAMACGTPIIGVREGGIREVILHEKTGLLVDRDPQEIAAAILRVLQDAAFSHQLQEAGREYVCEQWTWEKSFERLSGHFSAVLNSQ